MSHATSNRAVTARRGFHVLVACGAAALATAPALAQEAAARELLKTYRKLDTAEATRAAFWNSLGGSEIQWGRWWALAPFPHAGGAKDVATVLEPEQELTAMAPGGNGPDLERAFKTSDGRELRWSEVADQGGLGDIVDLAALVKDVAIKNSAGYLYRQVVATRAAKVKIHAGSDDGLRIWINGQLVVDAGVERPLDPDSHEVLLDLHPGVNHLLMKVTQGAGQWAVSLRPEFDPDPRIEAALDWQLASDFPAAEDGYYRLYTIPAPRGVVAEVGGLAVLTDGRIAVCTRRGDVYLISGASAVPPVDAKWTLFASGLQEPLGLVERPDPAAPGALSLVLAQRGELTRLTDTDGDGSADRLMTLCDRWQISGNYHEYAFGPVFDAQGNAYVNLNLAHTGGETVMGATVPTRGWMVRIAPDGTMTRYADGLRSPDGIGLGPDGSLFYTDNQGDYVATNKLSPVADGSFHGHQASLQFREGYGPNWRRDSKPVPALTWPAVWFPYRKMGQSASGFQMCEAGGKFGPFDGQMFVGDQTQCTINRVTLDKVQLPDGSSVWQGACYPFRAGLLSGVHRIAFAPDGSLYVGMTDRGWGSTGPKRFGVQRLVWTGAAPFEILAMTPTAEGFRLEFTQEVDAASAADASHYSMTSYTYDYHPDYGSNEMQTQHPTVREARVTGEGRTVELAVEGIRSGGMGYVHELHVNGVVSAPRDRNRSSPLLHTTAYYTLHHVPGGQAGTK